MATKVIAWQTGSGNITLTYQGQGYGTIIVQSDANDIGSARSQVITIETTEGSPVITKNLTISQAACPFPVGDVKNFSYTGSYQEVELPAGQYKLQCWGAQGGSNAAASSYGITAKAGGKGGYSEGIITLSAKTTVRVYVGGQGTSSAGGFNGGGTTSGSSSYSIGTRGQDGYHFGISKMGGGGGASDIRLSDGALLSRMIVAGGGSGGAMCYKEETISTTSWTTLIDYNYAADGNKTTEWGNKYDNPSANPTASQLCIRTSDLENMGVVNGSVLRITLSSAPNSYTVVRTLRMDWGSYMNEVTFTNAQIEYTYQTPPNINYYWLYIAIRNTGSLWTGNVKIELKQTSQSTDTYNDSQVGFVGGGTQGGGYSSAYQGKQNAAGVDGSFGEGAHQYSQNNRYASGAGGGGWYGGGRGYSSSDMSACKYSGGGSGWVNTYANRGNRPSGYTGLQLDSGSTTAGNTSFPAPGGGNETGHSGNGYARITRLS